MHPEDFCTAILRRWNIFLVTLRPTFAARHLFRCRGRPAIVAGVVLQTRDARQQLRRVVVDSYIDDFLIVDVGNSPLRDRETGRLWASSAQYCLNHIHTMLGMEFEPSKHKEAAPSNIILGVEVHLQEFLSECKVSFSPTKKRCEEILHQLRECERRGIITIMESASVLARLRFIFTASYRHWGGQHSNH